MKQVSALYIYPIKGLRGISLKDSTLEARGLAHDRRWMLVDQRGVFLSQRKLPGMALLSTSLADGAVLHLRHRKYEGSPLQLPLRPAPKMGRAQVQVWESECEALIYGDEVNEWFSDMLGVYCRLAYLPDDSPRHLPASYGRPGEQVGFADSCPLLVAGQASLDDLNGRLDTPVDMSRFRPNIVFTGGQAYEEDQWPAFQIGGARLRGIRRCARCQVVNIDQETAQPSRETLATLSSYRKEGHKVLFGLHAALAEEGPAVLRLGDEIIVD